MKNRLTFLCVVLLYLQKGQAQTIKNADFETGNTAYWQFSSPASFNSSMEAGYVYRVVKEATNQNGFVAHIVSKGNSQWCNLKQGLAYRPIDSIENLRLSADVKIKTTNAATAIIAGRAFQGLTRSGYFEKHLAGNQDWTMVSVDLIVTPKIDSLVVFCAMKGEGKVWFDNIKIEKLDAGSIAQSREARSYLDSAVSIIERNALYKDSVDFKGLVQYANIIAANAKVPSDCYGAIQYLLEGLKDRHSFFQTPEQVSFLNRSEDTSMLLPTGKRIGGTIGYIKVPPCMAINPAMEMRYADSLQRLIKRIDGKEIAGWIVDDRDNTGGNCWPMLLGLGPILGDGVYGRTKKESSVSDSIGYWNGAISNKDSVIIKTDVPYKLYKPYPKVALLMDGMSASSGESVILGFKNRTATKFFGEPSSGQTTGNIDFTLPDGAMIFVCATKATDRLGNEYSGKLYPDVFVKDNEKTKTDEVINAAVKWLKEKNKQTHNRMFMK